MKQTRWTIQSKHLETPPKRKDGNQAPEPTPAVRNVKTDPGRAVKAHSLSKPQDTKRQGDAEKSPFSSDTPLRYKTIVYEKLYGEKNTPGDRRLHEQTQFDRVSRMERPLLSQEESQEEKIPEKKPHATPDTTLNPVRPDPMRPDLVRPDPVHPDPIHTSSIRLNTMRSNITRSDTMDDEDREERIDDAHRLPDRLLHAFYDEPSKDGMTDRPYASTSSPIFHERPGPPFRLGPRFREPIRWVMSIVSATLLGAIVGYALLWLALHQGWFKTVGFVPGEGAKHIQESLNHGANSQIDADGTENTPVAGGGTFTLSKQTFYMLQGGVFKEHTSLEPLAERAKAQNVPVLILDGPPLRLVYGLLPDEQKAKILAEYYAVKNIDIFVRPIVLNASSAALGPLKDDEAKLLDRFLTHGFYLYTESATWMIQGIRTPVKIEEEAWRAFRETHQQFVEESRQLQNVLQGSAKDAVAEMTKEMTTAVTALVEYIKTPDENYLLMIEQAHLNFIKALATFYPDAFTS